MSDVAFLLLIFIMLVALINYRKEVKIEYPEAATAMRTSEHKNLEVWEEANVAERRTWRNLWQLDGWNLVLMKKCCTARDV
jgi:biopolymer transport protein ExbD